LLFIYNYYFIISYVNVNIPPNTTYTWDTKKRGNDTRIGIYPRISIPLES